MATSDSAPHPDRRKPDKVLIYTLSVSIVGLFILVDSLLNLPKDLTGSLMFALMVAAAQMSNVQLFQTSRGSSVSVAMVISIAAILTSGPLAGVQIQLISGLVTTISQWVKDRRDTQNQPSQRAPWFQRSAFNLGMFSISTAAAGVLFVYSGGKPGDLMHVENLLRVPLVAAADTLVNVLLLMTVIHLQSGIRFETLWKQDFEWSAPITIFGGAIGGALLALAYQSYGVMGALVFFLPIFAMGYAFRVYANNMRDYVNRLEQANQALQEKNTALSKNTIELLETLGAVIDAYDIYTLSHSVTVAKYAQAIAQKLDLPGTEQERIHKASLVHDIGKIGVPEDITGKPGRLNGEEMDQMRKHPTIGANILRRMQGFQDLIPLVQYHQEHFDGTGYPDGLRGEEIPLGARVLAVADAVDAMLTDRTYRQGHDFAYVQDEMKRCSGTQFDPYVVRAFLEVAAEKGPDFFHNSAHDVDRAIPTGSGARFLKRSRVEKTGD